MIISKRFWLSLLLVVSLSVSFAGIAMGQDAALKDLNHYLCKDIMRMTSHDRDISIGVLHAFLMGKKGTTQFDTQKLGDATDKFIEYCLDNPKEKALSVMEKMTK
jgi:hypothetical protein